MAALLLAAAFPLTLHDLPLPGSGLSVPLPVPGWTPDGYGQVAWLAFIALIPVLEAARQSRSNLEAFTWGYLAGLGWLVLHWMWLSSFGWLPVVLLSAWFALPVGLFALVARLVTATGRLGWLLWGLPAVWCGIEYLRSFGFWAFPWNLLGYSQARNLPLIQVADLGGVYLVGFVIVLANVAIWLVLTPVSGLRTRLGHAMIAAAVICAVFTYGEVRLAVGDAPARERPLDLALVQGGEDTYDRWSENRMTRALEAYIPPSDKALTEWDGILQARRHDTRGLAGPYLYGDLLVVWPETTLPRSMDPRNSDRIPFQLRDLLKPHENTALLTGAQGRPVDDDHAENGCLLVEQGCGEDAETEYHWAYSKVRLVPYGEVVPLREVARFLDYPWGNYDISEGREARVLDWRGHHLGLMVCFDNVFGFLARNYARQGAGQLVLVTNNSWYDLASGIRQHCDIDVLRAVELRRPVARVSTTGYSHIITPSGRVARETAVYSDGLITAQLAPGTEQTVYMLAGDAFAQLCLVAGVLLALGAVWCGKSEGIF